MDLTSELPFWNITKRSHGHISPLEWDLRCDALIVGGGIQRALLARQLVKKRHLRSH
jgi:hypothetical protein